MGDHAQTMSGDHGGGTPEETETVLFAMSFHPPAGSIPLAVRSPPCDFGSAAGKNCIPVFPQIDFSPTISMLLGVPIPFGSLGRVNPELWALSRATWQPPTGSHNPPATPDPLTWLRRYSGALEVNSWQVHRYLTEYSRSSLSPFPTDDFQRILALHLAATNHATPPGDDPQPLLAKIEAQNAFLREAAELARSKWTQFGTVSMSAGVLAFLLALTAHGVGLLKMSKFGTKSAIFGHEKSQVLIPASAKKWSSAIWVISTAIFSILALFLSKSLGFQASVLPFSAASFALSTCGAFFWFTFWCRNEGSQSFEEMDGQDAINAKEKEEFEKEEEKDKTKGKTKVKEEATKEVKEDVKEEVKEDVKEEVKEEGKGDVKEEILGRKSRRRGRGSGSLEKEEKSADMEHRQRILQSEPLIDSRVWASVLLTAVHAVSLLSNSFIMAEGHVARFLLATVGVLHLRRSFQEGLGSWKPIMFLLFNAFLGSFPTNATPATAPAANHDRTLFVLSSLASTYGPIAALAILLRLYFGYNPQKDRPGTYLVTGYGAPFLYAMVASVWLTEDMDSASPSSFPEEITRLAETTVPRYVYLTAALFAVTAIVTAGRSSMKPQLREGKREEASSEEWRVRAAIVAVCCAVVGPLVLLLGRRGPLVVILATLQGLLLLSLHSEPEPRMANPEGKTAKGIQYSQPMGDEDKSVHVSSAVEWSLFTVLLFFSTGHKCTFDGLHYSAAFTGFDDFNYFRQGALLALETFGASHILPTLTLPLLATLRLASLNPKEKKRRFEEQLAKLSLAFGLTRVVTTTMTVLFVGLERRHLMVWALFAPKYVFDVIGLLVIDLFLVLSVSFASYTYEVAEHVNLSSTKKRKAS